MRAVTKGTNFKNLVFPDRFLDGREHLLSKYQIKNVLGQYHSAFEHTFIWIVDADDPHLIEEFALEAGLTSFNNLTIVPLKSLKEGVIPLIKKVHGL